MGSEKICDMQKRHLSELRAFLKNQEGDLNMFKRAQANELIDAKLRRMPTVMETAKKTSAALKAEPIEFRFRPWNRRRE